MVKTPEKSKRQKFVEKEQVDRYARLLQVVAIIGVVCIVVVSQLVDSKNEIPIWIPAGLMGVAIGLSPEQFIDLIKSFFAGRKK